MGAKGAGAARSALLTVVCSIRNNVAKIATCVHYICEQDCAIFARFMHPNLQFSISDNRDFRAFLEQFSIIFVVHFRMVVNCTWSPLQTATSCTLHNIK